MIVLTDDNIKAMGFEGLLTTAQSLQFNAALDWIEENTDLDASDVENLPSSAKMFILKYITIMDRAGKGLASESIGGMSKSYRTDGADEFRALALQLLGSHYTGGKVKTCMDYPGWA